MSASFPEAGVEAVAQSMVETFAGQSVEYCPSTYSRVGLLTEVSHISTEKARFLITP